VWDWAKCDSGSKIDNGTLISLRLDQHHPATERAKCRSGSTLELSSSWRPRGEQGLKAMS
jgi:hypothetical protein